MWAFTSFGFFSVVKKGGNGDEWQVRARVRADLDNLIHRAHLNGVRILDTAGSDYRYRLVLHEDELTDVFRAFEESIDYPNFKSKLAVTRGQEKHHTAAHKVWNIMADLQETRPWSSGIASYKQRSLMQSDWYEQTFGHPAVPKDGHAGGNGSHQHDLGDDEFWAREEARARKSRDHQARSALAVEVGRRVNNLRRWNEWKRSGAFLDYKAWCSAEHYKLGK